MLTRVGRPGGATGRAGSHKRSCAENLGKADRFPFYLGVKQKKNGCGCVCSGGFEVIAAEAGLTNEQQDEGTQMSVKQKSINAKCLKNMAIEEK